MSPRGRRPGGADTRAGIVSAARAEFAENGYDATSLRAVARRAEVDPALVHHYFGGKPQLFAAVMDVPADPAALVDRVVAGPREQVGESLVRTFLALWDSPEGRPRFQALIRAAVSHDDATRMLREFLTREIFGRVTAAMAGEGEPPADLELRAGLAASQMIGVAMMRYVVEFPAVVAASHDELVAQVGPTLQRYLAP
ncbi:TetR family transcriptional regulator [Pedococcus sp. NPDC057267]|uniref:TetR/AcrR family transcriptional regulator n=1 Tax=Pedococcus sp. NPDC057267 TaxID=3346077 RepID=UPI0036339751